MKDKLVDALGTFGMVLWYIISVIHAIAPLVILHTPFWLSFLLLVAINVIPLFGEIIRLVLYVLAFIVAFSQPFDIFSIVFFVCTAFYVFTTVKSEFVCKFL